MPRRAINWLVLGFAALWFNVVLPVHKRGQITLGGNGVATSAGASVSHKASHACCPTRVAKPRPAADSGPGHCPDSGSRPAGDCAVCFFMAGLSTPPPITVIERRLDRAGERPLIAHPVPSVPRFALPLNSRAPPLA